MLKEDLRLPDEGVGCGDAVLGSGVGCFVVALVRWTET